MTTSQRQFIVAAAVEFIGIISIAVRFGANRGGSPLLVLGAVLVLVGLGWQIRALVRQSGRQGTLGASNGA